MRTIKFRGRIADGLRNAGQWVYWGIGGTDMLDAIDSESIGEYTGLKDKDGKAVYEGDVVQCLPGILIVRWDIDAAFRFHYFDLTGKIKEVANGFNGNLAHSDKTLEIIGNIYENPELLNDPPKPH